MIITPSLTGQCEDLITWPGPLSIKPPLFSIPFLSLFSRLSDQAGHLENTKPRGKESPRACGNLTAGGGRDDRDQKSGRDAGVGMQEFLNALGSEPSELIQELRGRVQLWLDPSQGTVRGEDAEWWQKSRPQTPAGARRGRDQSEAGVVWTTGSDGAWGPLGSLSLAEGAMAQGVHCCHKLWFFKGRQKFTFFI